MYINGAYNGNMDISSGVATNLSNPNSFSVGMIGDDTSGYYGDCSVNQVYVWQGRILSAGDVTELYGSGSGNEYPF
jgi:hypothetical protein